MYSVSFNFLQKGKYLFLFCECGCLPAFMLVKHVHEALTEAGRGLWIPLELELEVIFSHHVGLGIKPASSGRVPRAFYC